MTLNLNLKALFKVAAHPLIKSTLLVKYEPYWTVLILWPNFSASKSPIMVAVYAIVHDEYDSTTFTINFYKKKFQKKVERPLSPIILKLWTIKCQFLGIWGFHVYHIYMPSSFFIFCYVWKVGLPVPI